MNTKYLLILPVTKKNTKIIDKRHTCFCGKVQVDLGLTYDIKP
jgi:hypothetical protein